MHLRSLRPSLRGPLRPALLPAPRPPVAYYASGWTDADYYAGPAGAGRGVLGTVRLVGYLTAAVHWTQKVLASRINAGHTGGWRIQTGLAVDSISVIVAGAWGWAESARYIFTAGDIGRLFVLHSWVDGSGLHLAIGGAEIGSPAAIGGVVAEPAGEPVVIGRYPHAGGLASPQSVGVVSLCASPTAMTPAQIAVDAAAIMSSSRGIVLPTMPGEDMRFVASDALAGAWPDRIGNDCTLAETGSVSVSLVP